MCTDILNKVFLCWYFFRMSYIAVNLILVSSHCHPLNPISMGIFGKIPVRHSSEVELKFTHGASHQVIIGIHSTHLWMSARWPHGFPRGLTP